MAVLWGRRPETLHQVEALVGRSLERDAILLLLARGRCRRCYLLPPPDEIAAEIVESLEAALDRFRKVALSLPS
jgi:hypothetical protein